MTLLFNKENIGPGLTWSKKDADTFMVHFIDVELIHHIDKIKTIPHQMRYKDTIMTTNDFIFLPDDYYENLGKMVIVIDYFKDQKLTMREIPFKEKLNFTCI